MPKGIYEKTKEHRLKYRENLKKAGDTFRRNIVHWFVVFDCKNCHKEVSVKYKYRHRQFCSTICANTFISKMPSVRKIHSDIRRAYNAKRIGKSYEEMYGKEKAINMIKVKRLAALGEKNPMFNNWSSCEFYPNIFNFELKEFIRNRDGRQCQLCGINEGDEKLSVNHMNYDKDDCRIENLNALCRRCNAKVNGNRKYYTEFFQKKLIEKSGNTYMYGKEKLGVGLKNAINFLKNDKELTKRIADKITEKIIEKND